MQEPWPIEVVGCNNEWAHGCWNDNAVEESMLNQWNPPTPLWRWRPAYWGPNSHTKCSITFVNIAVAISALAGGAINGFAPRPELGGVCKIFRRFLGVWAQEGIDMEFWVILVSFRHWKNGQKWKNTVNSDILKGFWMPEHWKHCKIQCLGPTLCRKTCKLRCFWRKTL